jgi:hypothetical protein
MDRRGTGSGVGEVERRAGRPVALLMIAAVAAVHAGGRSTRGRSRRRSAALACAPRLPDACRHHPLVPAYGWPLARTGAGAGAGPPAPGPSGLPLVAGRLPPLPQRKLRRRHRSPPHRLQERRTAHSPSSVDRRGSDGWVEIVCWLYRPSLGWEAVRRRVTAGRRRSRRVEHAVRQRHDLPALVPLETLGRTDY